MVSQRDVLDDVIKLKEWSKPVEVKDSWRDMSNEMARSKEGLKLIERGEVKHSQGDVPIKVETVYEMCQVK